ncbi:MAG: RNA ligase RtcB family protein [Pseudomonadota bacterium]
MGNSMQETAVRDARPAVIHKFYTGDAWIEGKAEDQLTNMARWPGMQAVAAFPDLHPGKYGPVGTAALADRLYPSLIGNDIGCGMTLFQLDLPVRKLKPAKAADRLRALEGPAEEDTEARLAASGLPADFAAALGTIGGGNHFCEVQVIDEILDPDVADGLDPAFVCLLVHSGSRGLGNRVLTRVLETGTEALDAASDDGREYLADHDHALAWASLNRQVIAERAARALRADLHLIADVPHNFLVPFRGGWLHRKGAAMALDGLVPVAGSRATPSYLMTPLGAEDALASLAHGSGRKYDRASMHGRVGRKKSDLARMVQTRLGGHIVCDDRDLLIEEAPEAYKNPDRVIAELQATDAARPVARLQPMVTFKRAREGRS